MFRFMQPLKIPLQVRESRQAVVHRHRCGLGGFATAAVWAEIMVAAMAPRAENSWQILQTVNSFFLIFKQIQIRRFQNYIVYLI